MQDSILNIEVSRFADYNAPSNPRTVNLLKWLTSPKYATQVNVIRNITDKKERDKLKATLPAITPSGLFSYRAVKNLIRHSGFIQFDIDQKGNESIGNYSDLKKELCKISNVAYCGLSVSGKGFWGLIPIAVPEKHPLYFKYIEKWFERKGLKIDTAPKSVSSLRGYAYDPDGYFNHAAKPLQSYYIEPVRKIKSLAINSGNDVFIQANQFAVKKAGTFEDGTKHNFIFHLCCYLIYRRVPRQEAESWIYENLLPESEIKSNCISSPYENYKPGRHATPPKKVKKVKIVKL